MKKINSLVGILLFGLLLQSCADLDKDPFNLIGEDQLFSSESGYLSFLASLYNVLPVEDFNFSPQGGFNSFTNNCLAFLSDEGLNDVGEMGTSIGDGTWLGYWQYTGVRNVNYFLRKLPSSTLNSDVNNTFIGEAHFIRAYIYFGMVKRYGGVPLVLDVQNWSGDNLPELQVPRNTEQECYEFIAAELDSAISFLPATNVKGRATKYAALALKSRAMLYAASEAKYGTLDLTMQGLIGMPASEADHYWQAAFDAANTVIESGNYELYNQSSNKADNFQNLFLDESSSNKEVIFGKYFSYPDKVHSWDLWALPYGVRSPGGYGSRRNPTLEFVEQFEYTDGTTGPLNLVDDEGNPIHYADPTDLFANKDPRMFATVIIPFSDWKGTIIDVQQGIIDNGVEVTTSNYNDLYNPETHQIDDQGTIRVIGLNGVPAAHNEVSPTGFYIRKFLNISYDRSYVSVNKSDQQWIDLRLGEVLLNYAEAAIELGNVADAKWALNEIRSRAGIRTLDDAEVTIDKVRHERQVELGFESHRYWDIRRWRIAESLLNNTVFSAILPYHDINTDTYIFKTTKVGYGKTYLSKMNYERIDPGEIGRNPNLIQNPGY
jgi:hypothetical protein